MIIRKERVIKSLMEGKENGNLSDEFSLKIIQKDISPIINYEKLSRSVMGKYWRKANDAQKTVITEKFGFLLEKTYSKALTKYDEQKIRVIRAKETGEERVEIAVEIYGKGKTVEINYVFNRNDGVAGIVDLQIEGISLLSAYRRQFATVIKKQGIDGLIGILDKLINK